MTFTPSIPASGQTLGSSQPQILNNFAVLRSTIAVNHVDVNSSNPGTHTHVDLGAQGSDPNPATGFISLYSKTVSGITQLFLQRENTGAVIQMSVGTPTIASSGSTFLPGAMILKWGTFHMNSTVTSLTVNFAGGAFPNAIFSVVVTPNSGNVNNYAGATSVGTSGFVAKRSSSPADSIDFYYIAIGN
jgi:hypothetical protein